MKLKSLSNISLTDVLQGAAAIVLVLVVMLFITELTPSWLSWFITFPALLILMVTAAARVRDITGKGKRWFFRRLGLLLVASGTFAAIAAPLLGYTNAFPTWRTTVISWGFALTWLTTPNMPPWWKYINGEWKIRKGQQV